MLGRYGGDEFIVFLPEADARQAKEVAERIRSAVADLALYVKGEQLAVTVCIGLASYPTDSSQTETILDLADRALYRSKRDGRNRVTGFADLVRDYGRSSAGASLRRTLENRLPVPICCTGEHGFPVTEVMV